VNEDCYWCNRATHLRVEIQAMIDAGVHPEHPNVKNLVNRLRGISLYLQGKVHPDGLLEDGGCPATKKDGR